MGVGQLYDLAEEVHIDRVGVVIEADHDVVRGFVHKAVPTSSRTEGSLCVQNRHRQWGCGEGRFGFVIVGVDMNQDLGRLGLAGGQDVQALEQHGGPSPGGNDYADGDTIHWRLSSWPFAEARDSSSLGLGANLRVKVHELRSESQGPGVGLVSCLMSLACETKTRASRVQTVALKGRELAGMNMWRLDKLRGPRWIILLAPAVFMTLIAMAGSRVAGLFHDDSFFYAVVARNLAAGQGFSFDGVHATNGFHLLWVLVLGGINSVSPLRGMSGVMVMAALHLLLFAGVTFLYARILEKESVSPFNLSAFAISFLVCCGLADFGQESALYAMLLSSVMLLVWPWLNPRQQEKASAPRCTILCVAVAATVWSRLDAVVLIAFLGLYLLFVRRVRLFWCLAVASGLAMASLMFWNYSQFGHCATISSYLKAGFNTDKLKQLLNLGVSVRMGLSLALLVLAMFHALIQPEKKWLFRLLLFMTAGYVFYYGLLLSYVASGRYQNLRRNH